MACGCTDSCACFLSDSDTTTVTGTGVSADPWMVHVTLAVSDTNTIDFDVVAGNTITGDVILDPDGGLQATLDGVAILIDPASTLPYSFSAAGLLLDCCAGTTPAIRPDGGIQNTGTGIGLDVNQGEFLIGVGGDDVDPQSLGEGQTLYGNVEDPTLTNAGFPQDIGGQAHLNEALAEIIAMNIDLRVAATSSQIADSRLYLVPIYLPYTKTLTGLAYAMTTTGSFTNDNENKMGIYSFDGTDYTLEAETPDDGSSGTIWEQTAGEVHYQDFTAPPTLDADLYYVGILANWSAVATIPALLVSGVNTFVNSIPTGGGHEMNGVFSDGQLTLPATVAPADVDGALTSLFWTALR